MTLPPLPLTVIAGYLGAGKTTLINRLLAEDHGLKLLVMVNDFGAINIDAELLASADEDTIALTNGCVCCTMWADLFMAMGDALDRRPRPDHLIVEASGVADPARIANASIAEPEMTYAGIVTVVDGQAFESLSRDELVGPQICGQVSQSDLILVSKTMSLDPGFADTLNELSNAPVLLIEGAENLAALILGSIERTGPGVPKTAHPTHVSWSYTGDTRLNRKEIEFCLQHRPTGLFRLKGTIADHDSGFWEIHVVGDRVTISETASSSGTKLVGIGLKARTSSAEIENWWGMAIKKRPPRSSKVRRD